MNKYKLIVGLGNPGEKYQLTRHNVGFLLIDKLVDSQDFSVNKKVNSLVFKDSEIIYAKPLEFMNNSGESVRKLLQFYGVSPSEMLIIQDELDLDFGEVKISFGRGDAGHNGIKDIIEKIGTNEFYRLRFGIGKPKNPEIPTERYVLNRFEEAELEEIRNFKIQDFIK
jgi:peptidyl-tRNA hydrolase, PTH1 family